MKNHTTHVAPHSTVARFQPRCTCGWVGDDFTSREPAEARATLHRRNAALAEIMP